MKLGLIGCGRMGKALTVGAIDAGAVAASEVMAYDLYPAALEGLVSERGVTPAGSVAEVAAAVDVLLLCTKPYDVAGALQEIAGSGSSKESLLVISVAAGTTVEKLEREVADGARVIRSMPNTPALIGKGAAAFTRGSGATGEDSRTASSLLGSVGLVVETKESLMDAVTGLSGSGPAYVYVFIEALADGGVQNGLPRDQARALAAQTVLGAAAMVQSTGEHPAVLKDMVTSPGGTTIAGLEALEARSFRAACIEAVNTATRRAGEMGRD
jgi:pyrroline-5-carboxylate reductase